jgi:hypothetical protein
MVIDEVRRSSAMTQTRLAATCIVCLFAVWSIVGLQYGFKMMDHSILSIDEQSCVVGGQPTPEPTFAYCQTPTQNGPPCNNSDTSCIGGDSTCATDQRVELCADKKVYKNPIRCVVADTQLKCLDEAQPPSIVCYKYWTCYCIFDDQLGWICGSEVLQPDKTVNTCKNFQ